MMHRDLPSKAFNIASEWTLLHSEELLEMWETQEFRVLSSII